MSASTKRKLVAQEFLGELVLPDATKQQEIVQVIGSRGNNLHEIQNAAGERFLASMPTKFRKNIWIKRGDFVLVEPIAEGDRVKAEIINILRTKEQLCHIKANGCWPSAFEQPVKNSPEADRVDPSPAAEDSPDDDGSDMSDLSPNMNRRPLHSYDSDKEDTSEESD
ncbi:probable RNA-binding protein EIF1AD [Paramacrobiotus metropolitanus]|uniref:probable RNA-binding protein EIF1AD n=1 Tax=Paramacrobiotus metropolitanus TaxID=2943436 RepID=UPI00244590BA|nr:probable RNA-binding protein EIF1AD [Paramacrobiotus metropolitanus]XP_055337485.1 probable RNA-binding protein EIF1AD [Paramacrobiotus metropolitanus]